MLKSPALLASTNFFMDIGFDASIIFPIINAAIGKPSKNPKVGWKIYEGPPPKVKIGIPIKYLYYIDFNPYLQITPTVNIGVQYLQFEFSHERNFQNRFIF